MNAEATFSPRCPCFRTTSSAFTIGGPVVIPKIYNGRNKTFFFANVDWNRLRFPNRQFLDKFTRAATSPEISAKLPGKIITDPSNGI